MHVMAEGPVPIPCESVPVPSTETREVEKLLCSLKSMKKKRGQSGSQNLVDNLWQRQLLTCCPAQCLLLSKSNYYACTCTHCISMYMYISICSCAVLYLYTCLDAYSDGVVGAKVED